MLEVKLNFYKESIREKATKGSEEERRKRPCKAEAAFVKMEVGNYRLKS